MRLQAREKRTILIGTIVVIVALGYLFVLRPLMDKGSSLATTPGSSARQKVDRYADAVDRIQRTKRVRADLAKLTADLGIDIPTTSPLVQMKQLVEKFESLAGQSKVKIDNLTELRSRVRKSTTRAAERTDMKLDLTCTSFAGLATFIDNLEQMTVPIAFDQLTVTTSGARGGAQKPGTPPSRGAPSPGSGGPPGQPGGKGKVQMQVTLKIHTYLFPEKAQQ